jgi:hypothetical protein
MKDIEFISELFVMLIDGPQDQQKTLDEFYANYDVNFPEKRKSLHRFRSVLQSIQSVDALMGQTRFTKKADFYGLFGAVCQIIQTTAIDLHHAERALRNLDHELHKDPGEMNATGALYYSTVIEGQNKLPKRKLRIQILVDLLSH